MTLRQHRYSLQTALLPWQPACSLDVCPSLVSARDKIRTIIGPCAVIYVLWSSHLYIAKDNPTGVLYIPHSRWQLPIWRTRYYPTRWHVRQYHSLSYRKNMRWVWPSSIAAQQVRFASSIIYCSQKVWFAIICDVKMSHIRTVATGLPWWSSIRAQTEARTSTIRLVLWWVTTSEDRTLVSVRRCWLECVADRLFSRYRADTDVKWIKPIQIKSPNTRRHRQ